MDFISLQIFCIVIFIFFVLLAQNGYSDVQLRNIAVKCRFEYKTESNLDQCFKENIERLDKCIYSPFSINQSVIKTPLRSNANFDGLHLTTLWKSKVQPLLMSNESFDNVGEPSIASNGSFIFYTGNHYAAKSSIGKDWNFVDPFYDFKGHFKRQSNTTSVNTTDIDLFNADQRTIYDPYHKLYLWIRLGERYAEGQITNIVRLSISNDTTNWTVYDFIPVEIFNADINDAQFDYPDVIISKDYLYLTSSLVVGQYCEKEYGAILRISLNDLDNSLSNVGSRIPYYVLLDRNVTGIAPVDGLANNTAYFGAQINNSLMKIYEWKQDSDDITSRIVPIDIWNNIHNSEYCGSNPSNSQIWWCKANTSSRIRSAWLYNDTLNFLWNAVISYDNGTTWKPYINTATFNINNNMSYEKKYYVADSFKPWIFGAAIPSNDGKLGIAAYYITNNDTDPNINPYLNLAFGIFNHTTDKWGMTQVVNSSTSLPVKDEEMKDDYNFGDFITIRKHPPQKDGFLWDIGAYVIVGRQYYDVDPYFIMIK